MKWLKRAVIWFFRIKPELVKIEVGTKPEIVAVPERMDMQDWKSLSMIFQNNPQFAGWVALRMDYMLNKLCSLPAGQSPEKEALVNQLAVMNELRNLSKNANEEFERLLNQFKNESVKETQDEY